MGQLVQPSPRLQATPGQAVLKGAFRQTFLPRAAVASTGKAEGAAGHKSHSAAAISCGLAPAADGPRAAASAAPLKGGAMAHLAWRAPGFAGPCRRGSSRSSRGSQPCEGNIAVGTGHRDWEGAGWTGKEARSASHGCSRSRARTPPHLPISASQRPHLAGRPSVRFFIAAIVALMVCKGGAWAGHAVDGGLGVKPSSHAAQCTSGQGRGGSRPALAPARLPWRPGPG